MITEMKDMHDKYYELIENYKFIMADLRTPTLPNRKDSCLTFVLASCLSVLETDMRRSEITLVVCVKKKKGSKLAVSKCTVILDQIIPNVA